MLTRCDFKIIYTEVREEHPKQWLVTAVFNYAIDLIPILSGTMMVCIIKNRTFKTGFSQARCFNWIPYVYLHPNVKGTMVHG